MQGFRKVDADRWEFANEAFLGKRHLLKTMKRRRNAMIQSMSQQRGGGVPCVELGQYEKEEEVERMRRDRDVLMAEVLKLMQQYQSSRERLMVIEERMRGSETKKQRITRFVAKAFSNPLFVERVADGQKRVGLGQKRRLTMSPTSAANVGGTSLDPITDEVMEKLVSEDEAGENLAPDQSEVEAEMEALISAADVGGTSSNMLEMLLSEDEEVEPGDLDAGTPCWGEDLQELVDELGFM